MSSWLQQTDWAHSGSEVPTSRRKESRELRENNISSIAINTISTASQQEMPLRYLLRITFKLILKMMDRLPVMTQEQALFNFLSHRSYSLFLSIFLSSTSPCHIKYTLTHLNTHTLLQQHTIPALLTWWQRRCQVGRRVGRTAQLWWWNAEVPPLAHSDPSLNIWRRSIYYSHFSIQKL